MTRALLPLVLMTALVGVPLNVFMSAWVSYSLPREATGENPLFEALGTAKEALGNAVYATADTYFHKGMERGLVQCERAHDHEGEEDAHDTDHGFVPRDTDWVMWVNNRLKVVEHSHLSNEEAVEILPLLYASTKLNPKNIEGVLTAAYWIEEATGSTDQALEALSEAAPLHPEDWRIPYAIAKIHRKRGEDRRAVPFLEKAVGRLNPQNALPFDWVSTRFDLAQALERTGDPQGALRWYREAYQVQSQKEGSPLAARLKNKIDELSNNFS